jgi:hypothetical protein
MPCTPPLGENAAGGSAAKEPVDANVAGTTIKAVKLAGPSRAADLDASNSAQGTGRAKELAGPSRAADEVASNSAQGTGRAQELAGLSRAADEEASNSAQGTGRAQELRKQLAKCRADTAEILKELAANRETLEKLEAARRLAQQRAADGAQQRAAAAAQRGTTAAAQQAPTRHLAHGEHLEHIGDRSAAGYQKGLQCCPPDA